MEDFLASNQLHILNEGRTTAFQSSRGKNNIDLTIANSQMVANIWNWYLSEEESASDHKIIKFNITLDKVVGKTPEPPGVRFIIREHQKNELYEKFHYIGSTVFQIEKKRRRKRRTEPKA